MASKKRVKSNILEPLYIDQQNDVFVPEVYASKITQLQREGIRFLYKQFHKNKSGVILNDASGCGKTVQIVLFVDCLRNTLANPSLVLCENIEHWQKHFEEWSDNASDVIYQSPTPFTKKKIFVNTIKDIEKLSQRKNWGIVVVDNDDAIKNNKQLKLLKGKFKIWLTNMDVLRYLELFSSIHEWIKPNEKLNVSEFLTDSKEKSEFVSKKILLESYFEDVVIRRRDQIPDHDQISQRNVPEPRAKVPLTNKDRTIRKVSIKNKDPTGTKVKSSKKRKKSADKIEDKVERNNTKINKTAHETGETGEIEPKVNLDDDVIMIDKPEVIVTDTCVVSDVEAEDPACDDIETFITNSKRIECKEIDDYIDKERNEVMEAKSEKSNMFNKILSEYF